MKTVKYNTLLEELKDLVETLKNSSSEEEEKLNRANAIDKCKKVLSGIENNRIEIRRVL